MALACELTLGVKQIDHHQFDALLVMLPKQRIARIQTCGTKARANAATATNNGQSCKEAAREAASLGQTHVIV